MSENDKLECDRELKPEWSRFRDLVHAGGGQWLTQIYHYLGAGLAFFASRVGVSPNQLTLLSMVIVISSMVLMLMGGMGNVLVAACVVVLMVLSYALDCADGQLARATKQCSKLGAWLDHLVDSCKIFVVHLSVGWMLISTEHIHGLSPGWCFLAMAVNIAGSALYFFAWNFKVLIAGEGLIVRLADESRQNRIRLLQFSHQFTDYGWFPLLFILLIDPEKFALAYLIYGFVTFLIFMGYIAISSRYMAKLSN